jgi:hypothetical protein
MKASNLQLLKLVAACSQRDSAIGDAEPPRQAPSMMALLVIPRE